MEAEGLHWEFLEEIYLALFSGVTIMVKEPQMPRPRQFFQGEHIGKWRYSCGRGS